MAVPRYFTDFEVAAGALVVLDLSDAHHASTVLRCNIGEPLTLVSSGVAWDAEFDHLRKRGVIVRALRHASDQGGELPAPVVVLQALTKGAKFDEVVEKTVELGAVRIVPMKCERCEAEGGSNKLERWRRIARAAAMQSRRRVVPAIDATISWGNALARYAPGTLTLVAFEAAPPGTFETAMRSHRLQGAVVIAVGPEGGLHRDEVDAATAQGAHVVSLGPTILRTETAAAALLAAVASRAGWW
ncbi:MAG TPA: RsmE family RNA methyltransferase [Candidatus Eremiobacteraceae bacterium]